MLRCLRLHFSCAWSEIFLSCLGICDRFDSFELFENSLHRLVSFCSFVVSESLFDLLADVFHLSLHLFCPYSFFFRRELWAFLLFSVNLFFSLWCCRSHVLLLCFSYRLLFLLLQRDVLSCDASVVSSFLFSCERCRCRMACFVNLFSSSAYLRESSWARSVNTWVSLASVVSACIVHRVLLRRLSFRFGSLFWISCSAPRSLGSSTTASSKHHACWILPARAFQRSHFRIFRQAQVGRWNHPRWLWYVLGIQSQRMCASFRCERPNTLCGEHRHQPTLSFFVGAFADTFCFYGLSLPSFVKQYSNSVFLIEASAHEDVTTFRLPYLFCGSPGFAQENCVSFASFDLLEEFVESVDAA